MSDTPPEVMAHDDPEAGDDCWGTQCEMCGCCMHTPENGGCRPDLNGRCWNDDCGCSMDWGW